MKKKYVFITIIVMIVALILYCIYQSKGVRIGFINDDLPTLTSGSYQQGENLDLKSGTYALYAKSGQGEVQIDDKIYTLNDELYIEAKKQPMNTQNAVIYEESPKILIESRTKISVKSDKEFSGSFIRR